MKQNIKKYILMLVLIFIGLFCIDMRVNAEDDFDWTNINPTPEVEPGDDFDWTNINPTPSAEPDDDFDWVTINPTSDPDEDEKSDSNEVEEENVPVNCGILDEIMPYIEDVFNWIQILVPIALIVFGFIDFTGPIISSDKDALNKATSKFIKRCIIAVIIFFVPIIVELLLDIYNDATGSNASTCGLGKIVINYWR